MDVKAMFEKMQEEQYLKYVEDVRIANDALEELKLESSSASVVCDLYAVPSHNHQAYYAKVLEEKECYYLLYARTEIDVVGQETIFMYPFRDAQKAKDISKGRIVCGMKVLKDVWVEQLLEGLQHLPPKHILEEDLVVICDGEFQAVRVFENSNVVKEVVYQIAQCLPVKDEWKQYFGDLYLNVEKILEEA